MRTGGMSEVCMNKLSCMIKPGFMGTQGSFGMLGMVVLLVLAGCANQQSQKAYSGKESSQHESARVHTELGAGYYGQNQLAIALEEFTEATRLDPNYALAYNGLGLVYSALKEDSKADANFKKSVQMEPNNSQSRNNYGTFLCSRNRIDESITQFMDAVKNPLYTTPAVAYMNAGICSLRKNDTVNAETYFQKALIANPGLSAAAYQLGLIYFNKEQYTFVRAALQNALSNNPSPEVLWLAIRTERILGNKDAVSSYTLELRRQYPKSEQTKALLQGQ